MRVPTRATAAVLLACGLMIAACGDDDDDSAAEDTTATEGTGGTGEAGGTVDCQPITDGVLTVVTSLPGPNFWGTTAAETDPDDIQSGIEYDLATRVAEVCGLEMEFRNESFDAIVAGQIAEDSYDIIFSQVTITEERDEVVDFSVPYFKSDQGLLVPTGTEVSTWDEVKAMTIGVQATTTAEFYFLEIPEWKLDSDPQSFPDLTSAYEALSAGQVDGVVIDTPINLGQASQSDGELEVVAQFSTGEEYGAIYPEGSAKKAVFDGIIQGLVDDGTVNELIAQYLGGDPSTVPFIEVGS
jgi:polar amino acid transport system substrate-binding protein